MLDLKSRFYCLEERFRHVQRGSGEHLNMGVVQQEDIRNPDSDPKHDSDPRLSHFYNNG